MEPSKYHYNRYLGMVLSNNPKDMEPYILLAPINPIYLEGERDYVLFIDKKRKFANIKELFLKRLLKICEKERRYSEPFWIRTLLLFKKQCLTICEMLGN